MKITDLFIRRPVLAVVVNLVILIAGLQAVKSLSVRQYPRSDVAVITVSTEKNRKLTGSPRRLPRLTASKLRP